MKKGGKWIILYWKSVRSGDFQMLKKASSGFWARIALFAAAIIWGSSFIFLKDSLGFMPPNYLIAIRFSGAFVLLSLIFIRKYEDFTADYLWRGAIIGFFIFAAYSIQTIGLQSTTPGVNAFLAGMYSVFVPFMLWALKCGKPDRYNIIAVCLSTVGAGLVMLKSGFSVEKGDLLSLNAAIMFALHIVMVEKFGKNKDMIMITIMQFLFAAVYSWITAFIFEKPVFGDINWFKLAYLSVFCTAIALLFQNVGQKLTNPSASSIILSLESVFGIIISMLLGYETLSLRSAIGFTMIFCAVVVSETKLSFLRKKT